VGLSSLREIYPRALSAIQAQVASLELRLSNRLDDAISFDCEHAGDPKAPIRFGPWCGAKDEKILQLAALFMFARLPTSSGAVPFHSFLGHLHLPECNMSASLSRKLAAPDIRQLCTHGRPPDKRAKKQRVRSILPDALLSMVSY
jgi:hypothetical protein